MGVCRAKSGIEGLDEVIGGCFPKGSLILLAGRPGTGKTVFSMSFLVEGCVTGEPGVYVGFAESKKTLIENLSRHLGVDLRKLESEDKLRILDFTAMKEKGVFVVLNAVLDEVRAIKAKRLVVDSFSAMAQALGSPIDIRIIVQLVLSRIVREMGCTTLMIGEVPIGRSEVGFGVEEFMADGIIVLKAEYLDERLFRDLELIKLRGVRLNEPKLAFTLEGGFKAFPPFKTKPVREPKRFQPIQDPPDGYSTGSKDLDEALGGGVPKGSTMLLELDEKTSTPMYHLLTVPMAANFMFKGRGVLIIPSGGVDPQLLHRYLDVYGGTEEEWRRYIRILVRGLKKTVDLQNVVTINGEYRREDFDKVVKIAEELRAETGQPVLSIIGVDTLITLYGERLCEEILNLGATEARKAEALLLAIVKAGYRDLAVRLSPIADVYLRLTREDGCMLMYGVRPRTGLYAVEMDVSKGYPLPRLTPIV